MHVCRRDYLCVPLILTQTQLTCFGAEDLCFGNSVDAINAPEHKAPIILAMDASLPVFVGFKHSSLLKGMIVNCPPDLSRIVSPATSGLIDLQQVTSQILSQ